jgi:tetratricopeptide (TPR) repeat protein
MLRDPRNGNYAKRLADEVADGHPEIRAEAINCGGMCYASYRLVGVVEEVLGYDPDVVIVMSGNNEFLEPRHYGKLMSEDSIRRVKDREANVGAPILYRLRLGQLIATLIESARPETALPSGDKVAFGEMIPERYIVRDDEERRLTLAHYARNLNRMADLCEEKGVPIVLCTVPTNLRDFAPFRTEPYAGISAEQARRRLNRAVNLFEAERYEECLAACRKELVLDERAAVFHFMAAQALLKLGRNEEAKEHFVKARDHDAFPHRTTSEFNEKVREIARRRGLPLYDAEREFRNASPNGTPGKSLFKDQCHPNQVGHDMIAAGLAAILDPLLFP